MSTKSKSAAAVLASISALALSAALAGRFRAPKVPPVQKTAATRTTQAPAARANPSASAAQQREAQWQYEYVNDEAGWQLKPAHYEFKDGKLVHADDCPFAPQVASR